LTNDFQDFFQNKMDEAEYEKITFTDEQMAMIEKESVELFLIDLGKVIKKIKN
jgi:hypothetical protein